MALSFRRVTNPTLTTWTYSNTPASLSVTTSWASYSVTSAAISASTTNLAVFIWSNATTTTQTTDILRVGQVQLELGSTATSFEARHVSDELERCRRYHCTTSSGAAPGRPGVKALTTAIDFFFVFPVTMRGAPTISTAITAWDGDGSPASGSISAYSLNDAGSVNITGALTAPAVSGAMVEGSYVRCVAATSFSGTVGANLVIYLGSPVESAAEL